MFYITQRSSEQQCTPGELCMVLADFSGILAGTRGIVTEIYDSGVSIAWYKTDEEALRIIQAIREGTCYPARGYSIDGFSRDELVDLGIATLRHPNIDAKVYMMTE